jgi:hypothetical protein
MVADIFDSGDELTSRTSPSPAFCSEAEWAAPRKVANDKTTIFAMAPVDFRKLAGLSIIRLTFSILIRAVHQLRYLHGWPAVCSALTGFSFHHQPLLSLHLDLPSKAPQHASLQPMCVWSGTFETNHAPVQIAVQIACHMSESGTKRNCRAKLTMSVDGGKSEVRGKQPNRRD